MLKSAQVFWAVLVASLLADGSAQAQRSPDWARCIDKKGKFSADAAVSGCSSVISSNTETRHNLAVAYGRRGNAYYDRRAYDSAIADYTKAIEINARDAVAYNNRGIAYRAKGDIDNAIADYSKAIEINPTDSVAYNHRGIARRAKGEYDSAIADHTKAIDIDPELATAYNNRGVAYRAKGEYDRAIADYGKAIDIDPELASAYHNRGVAYRAKGDNDRAIADLNKAIAINPERADAYHNRRLDHRVEGDQDRDVAGQTKASEPYHKPADDTVVPVNIAKAAPPPSIEKTALPTNDAPRAPFTLLLKADLSAQQVTVLENSTVIHVWPISSGVRDYATPTGTFQPKWANRMWYSRQYNWTPMPYAVFFTRGVAFHGTNVTSRLGKSASHGCIRLATSNAAQLFHLVHKHGFAQTQIIVYGAAKHDSSTLARRVPTARTATTASNGFPNWARALFNH